MNNTLICNWKLNPLALEDAQDLFLGIGELSTKYHSHVVVCPPALYLQTLLEDKYHIDCNCSLGGQNIFYENEGAFTGQISAKMLENLGIRYSIIGHSEVRKAYNLSNEQVSQSVEQALNSGITPIVCVGLDQDTDDSEHMKKLEEQVITGIKSLVGGVFPRLYIAYEPIWAIGTGKIATKEPIQKVLNHLTAGIKREYGAELLEKIVFLYGGSVNSQNITELQGIEHLGGFLVGKSSLDVQEVQSILNVLG